MKRNNRGSWSLVGLLVVAAIIVVVVAVKFAGGPMTTADKDKSLLDKASTKKTTVGRAIDTGKSVECREQLRQIRVGIDMYKQTSTSGGPPPTLKEAVPSVSSAYFQCPVTGQAYTYDPATGTVTCPSHPTF